MHALGKRILDKTAAETRDRLSDLVRDELPTVEMARALQSERKPEKLREKNTQTWDRDHADRIWQDAVINAAIDKERVERKVVEPKRREAGAGDRQKEAGSGEKLRSVIHPIPEPIRASVGDLFSDSIQETFSAKRSDNRSRSVKVGKTAARVVGKSLDAIGNAVESLFAPPLTPEQIRDAEKAARRREADAENVVDFSKFTAEMAHQRRQQENEQEAERRQHRERNGGGRER